MILAKFSQLDRLRSKTKFLPKALEMEAVGPFDTSKRYVKSSDSVLRHLPSIDEIHNVMASRANPLLECLSPMMITTEQPNEDQLEI